MPGSAFESNISRASGFASPKLGRSRAHSVSSDKPSTAGHHNLTIAPSTIYPDSAYIAFSAACQIVTNDHDSHASIWYDQNGVEPADEAAIVSDGALQLVNSFLDHLLFNFLQVSRSTTLAGLRPAVSEILKPKLAKDTINNADEELREYLGGADEEDYVQPQGSTSRGWDLELVWKRTRLRCMVYSSLGDMEEEDEDMYMEEENLAVGVDEEISDVISPAVAIFLTSVIEYMGELTLTVAGQAAYQRVRSKIAKDLKDGNRHPGDMADRIVVEESDMERVALDRTLGRLWRGWKKRLRGLGSNPENIPRPYSRESSGHLRQESLGQDNSVSPISGNNDSKVGEARKTQERKDSTIAEDVQPHEIPLPIGDRDIDEIEVPGLIRYSDDEDEGEDDEDVDYRKFFASRPKSLFLPSSWIENGLLTPTGSEPSSPSRSTRARSLSMPKPRRLPFFLTTQPIETQVTSPNEDEDVFQEAREAASESEYDDDSTADVDSTQSEKRPIVKPKPVTVTDEHDWESDGTDEVATYEKAEIVTSARVSVASASSPSISDTVKSHRPTRSSSGHSARIIDVGLGKSPNVSRPASIDSGEKRSRPASLEPPDTGAAPKAVGHHKQTSTEKASHPIAPTSVPSSSWTPVDRSKSVMPTPPTISESEEEPESKGVVVKDEPQVKAQQRRKVEVPSKSEAVAKKELEDEISKKPRLVRESKEAEGRNGLKKHSLEERAEVLSQPIVQVHPVSDTAVLEKVTLKNDTVTAVTKLSVRKQSYDLTPIDTQAPDIPRRAPGHSPRLQQGGFSEAKSSPGLQRMRSRDYDEDLPPSLHDIGSPRPIHTSGSSSSSVTGRLKPMRTSEENSSTSRSESVARNFEELIQSNQTITYTLTPENMRDPNRPLDSPVLTKLPRKSEEVRTPTVARFSPTTEFNGSPSSYRSPRFKTPTIDEDQEVKLSGPIPRAPTGLAVTTGRMGTPQAREARIPGDSTADFADFVKSTGPTKDGRSLPRNANGPVMTAVSKGAPEDRRMSSSSAASRSRYQARDAVVDNRPDKDLIEFIRQGPPIAPSNHRIPRHIAPFRTTMDSDQMSGVSGGKAVDATIPDIRYSQASTNATENSVQSVESSMHSSAALIGNGGSKKLSKMFDNDDMMPTRKTRRVRDPYAIDFSDEEDMMLEEEEEELAPFRPLPRKGEESLAEFLKNYDPPPVPASSRKLPAKKASAPSLMSRFTRTDTGTSARESNASPTPIVADTRSLHSRASTGRGHIPIQVNMPSGYDKYGPVSIPSGRPRMASTSGASAKIPMKKFEPRDPVAAGSQTAELAAFLRNSRPPPEMEPRPLSIREEEPRSFSRVFGRKKRTGLV